MEESQLMQPFLPDKKDEEGGGESDDENTAIIQNAKVIPAQSLTLWELTVSTSR